MVCQGAALSAATKGGDNAVKSNATNEPGSLVASRSSMASRWAVKPERSGQSEQREPSSPIDGRLWFKTREDLFDGKATVDNASGELFKTMTGHTEKRAKQSGKKVEPYPADSRFGVTIKDGNSLDGQYRFRGKQAKLTGANIMAVGGDNGWGERSKPVQRKDTVDMDGRDPPPHLASPRAALTYFGGIEGGRLDSGYGMSPERKREKNASNRAMYGTNEGKGLCSPGNADLLREAFVRMERENESTNLNSHANGLPALMDNTNYEQSASGWD